MTVAVLFAVVGTVSSFFGLVLISSHAPGGENTGISLTGWLVLFGWACYALSALQAMGVARGRWLVGRDAVWPLVWAFAMFTVVAWLGAAVLTAILGPLVPGRYPWAPVAIVGVGFGCAFAAACLIATRFVLSVIRASHTFAER